MKLYTIILFLLTFGAQAQYQIAGVVIDAETKSPIPFATIRTQGKMAMMTDLKGRFSIPAEGYETISISYSGYQSRELRINPTPFITLEIFKTQDLDDIAADAIISEVIKHKNANNPLARSQKFRFKSYNRMVITAEPDSIDGRIDTIRYKRPRKGRLIKVDSSDYKFKRLIEKQHLFQTEKVSQFDYNIRLHELVLGTKMAGFKEPVYEVFGFQLMPFSIYSEPFVIFETVYNNPIADDALRNYHYKFLDTITYESRHTAAIYFKPKGNTPQSALQGLLLIDLENFAIAKAIISSQGVIDITTEHISEYTSQNVYYPKSVSLKIVKGNNEEEIRIFGEALKFAATPDAGSRKYASDFAYLHTETTYFDYDFSSPVRSHLPDVTIDIPDNAIQKPEEFWTTYRPRALDGRSLNTYAALDSIARRQGVERKLRFGRKIINGYVPLGFFDVDLRQLISFNNHEGFRLGFGGITNNKLSDKYRLFGYTAYGTKDGLFKYQLGGAARIGKYSDTWAGISYTDDIQEIAITNFAVDKRTFKIYDPRPINVSTFFNDVAWRAYIETKIIPGTESIWQLSQNVIRPLFEYTYLGNNQAYRNFSLTTAMVSVQWNPFSDYMQTPAGRIEIIKRFPKFTFQFTQAIPNLLGNDLEFGKVEFRTAFEKKFINRQKLSLLLEAGVAYGELPITHAYNTSPNNLSKDRLLQRITLAGKNSFETMYFNEFFSDRFVFMQYKYAFNHLLISDKIKPTPVLATRLVWGDMDKRGRHQGIEFKTLDHGFYESGMEFNGIYKGLGLSAFYRYGANHLPRLEDNIAIKLSFVLNIGF